MKLNNTIKLDGDIIGLDLGMSRTGVARLHTIAKIAQPLKEIDMKQGLFISEVQRVLEREGAVALVVGLPRSLEGKDTEQTLWVHNQVELLEQHVIVPVFTSDEAGTTIQAEKRVKDGESVDSVAAGIILETFIEHVEQGKVENVSV